MSDLDRIIKLLRTFARTAWPAQAKNIIDESYQMYAYMLQTIPYEVLVESMGILVQTKTFWPSISEIREVAASLKHTAQGQDLTPAEAWVVPAYAGVYRGRVLPESCYSSSPRIRGGVSWSLA